MIPWTEFLSNPSHPPTNLSFLRESHKDSYSRHERTYEKHSLAKSIVKEQSFHPEHGNVGGRPLQLEYAHCASLPTECMQMQYE